MLDVRFVKMDGINLSGSLVQLETLECQHIDGLSLSTGDDSGPYQRRLVPCGREAVASYVDTALAWRDAGMAIPFAIIRLRDNLVIGSTRFGTVAVGPLLRIARRAFLEVRAALTAAGKELHQILST